MNVKVPVHLYVLILPPSSLGSNGNSIVDLGGHEILKYIFRTKS